MVEQGEGKRGPERQHVLQRGVVSDQTLLAGWQERNQAGTNILLTLQASSSLMQPEGDNISE